MLRKVICLTAIVSLIFIAGICLLLSGAASRHFPFSLLDAFALQYLPNATSFAGASAHQQAIRISSTFVLFSAIALALMLALLARTGLTLKAALRNEDQRISSWPILLVVGALALLPFLPLLNPESMASVRLVAEGMRSSRLILLLFSLISFGGYLVVWFLVFHALITIFRRS